MKCKNLKVVHEKRFAIGVAEKTGTPCISIPVRNPFIEYQEYYGISQEELDTFLEDPYKALPLVERCRKRKEDHRLLEPPAPLRGYP